MQVNLYNDKLIQIEFNFDRELLAVVKSLPDRKYEPISKTWFVPVIHAGEIVSLLQPLGFTIDPRLDEKSAEEAAKHKELKRLAVLEDVEFESPFPLANYQRIVANFMVAAGSALNACDVGLGKTLTTIAVCEKLKLEKKLIVCPKILIYQWQLEILKWIPNATTFIVTGNKKNRQKVYDLFQQTGYGYLIMGYETMRDDNEILQKM